MLAFLPVFFFPNLPFHGFMSLSGGRSPSPLRWVDRLLFLSSVSFPPAFYCCNLFHLLMDKHTFFSPLSPKSSRLKMLKSLLPLLPGPLFFLFFRVYKLTIKKGEALALLQSLPSSSIILIPWITLFQGDINIHYSHHNRLFYHSL